MRNTMIGQLAKITFVLSLVLLTAGTVSADSIMYTFTGTGSGSVGTSNFTNQSVTITVLGATENVTNPLPSVFANRSLGTSIGISGIATVSVLDLTNMFSNSAPLGAGIGLGDSTTGFALFGLVPANSYNLMADFGPLFNASPVAAGQFNNIPTTDGTLDMTSWTNVTFNAALSPVPEPGSALLLAVGLLGAALVGCVRRVA
jgi:hypothetical protein